MPPCSNVREAGLHSNLRELMKNAPSICVALVVFLCGCGGGSKASSGSDASAIQHQGARVIVPASNPLASRLQGEPVGFTTFTRRVSAPASVEADPARYA